MTGALSVSTQLAIGNSPGTTNFSSSLTLGAGSTFVTITAVPEPNVATLLGGLGVLALLRRRR